VTAPAISPAQQNEIDEIRNRIAALGVNFDNDTLAATQAIYRPLVAHQPKDGVTLTSDIAYGDHERQKLDVYRGTQASAPVLIYVPGGGFVGGDKSAAGEFYANVGTYFARHGYLTVIPNYRLAPGAPWPAGAEDVGATVAWAKANAASHGGDPGKIFIWGQSAGATHVSTYLFDDQFHPAGGPGITAAVLMSGPYKFEGALRGNLVAYFGSDPALYPARSPLTHAGKSRVPLLLSVAQYDPDYLAAPTFELAAAVTMRDGHAPAFAFMEGHNHVSTVQSIGSVQDDVGAKVRAFLAGF